MAISDKTHDEPNITARLIQLIMKLSEDEQRRLLDELETTHFLKKRKHDRKPYFSVVDYASQGGAYTDFIQNISAGGLFIGTGAPFHVGQQLSLGFPLPISQKHIIIGGEIAWVSPKGIGVKFSPVDRELETMIRSLVDMI
ncbi:MAG: PilZ domain-containing protein [Desulfobacteraceae bacterium]|jgi:Tfp pilus assembly protein PilZ